MWTDINLDLNLTTSRSWWIMVDDGLSFFHFFSIVDPGRRWISEGWSSGFSAAQRTLSEAWETMGEPGRSMALLRLVSAWTKAHPRVTRS